MVYKRIAVSNTPAASGCGSELAPGWFHGENIADCLRIELRRAVIIVDAVLLLLDVCQLRVAVACCFRVFDDASGKFRNTLFRLHLCERLFVVTPGVVGIGLRSSGMKPTPPYSSMR